MGLAAVERLAATVVGLRRWVALADQTLAAARLHCVGRACSAAVRRGGGLRRRSRRGGTEPTSAQPTPGGAGARPDRADDSTAARRCAGQRGRHGRQRYGTAPPGRRAGSAGGGPV